MLAEAQDIETPSEGPSKKTPHSPIRVLAGLDEQYSADEIMKMSEMYEGTLSNIEEGEIVKSKVLRVTDAAVILDVGFKSEGAVPIDEFKDPKSLRKGTKSRSTSSISRTRRGQSSSPRRRPTSCGCGSVSAKRSSVTSR